jgi:hypothetical protein
MIGRLLMRHVLAADPDTTLGWNQPNDVLYQIDPQQRTRTAIRVLASQD